MTTSIRPVAAAVDPAGPPPTFAVRTDRTSFEIELTTDPLLFDAALASRRGPANFFASGVQSTRDGTRFRPPADAWRRLARRPAVYYRARAMWRAADGKQLELTTGDGEAERAPSIGISRLPLPPRRRRASRRPWLRTAGNAIIDETGALVVLRGVNHSAFERATRPVLKAADIRAMVGDWRANIVRLPVRQDALLTDRRYLLRLDDAIAEISAHGAYVLIALRRLDGDSRFGTRGGQANALAPLPDENTLRLWRTLATRYRDEPAVLYDVFTAPHRPLPDDGSAVFRPPLREEDWALRWTAWARRIVLGLQRVHPRAITVVPGFDWGTDLPALPLCRPDGEPLDGVVYALRAFPDDSGGGERPAPPAIEGVPGVFGLRAAQPVMVAEWGGAEPWARTFEGSMRELHDPDPGYWGGVAGWSAWSWTDPPALLAGGEPTPFGAVVHAALATPVGSHRAPPGIHAPLVAARDPLRLGGGVGAGGAANAAADVRAVQDRLVELRWLAAAAAIAEQPTEDDAPVPAAALARTIAAILAVQADRGLTPPDGRVDPGGATARALDRAIALPTAAELAAVAAARAAVTESETRGLVIEAAVGNVAAGSRPADLRTVQARLVSLGYLAADHGEAPPEGAGEPIASAQLPRTRAAIEAFRDREVGFWSDRGAVSGDSSSEVVHPADATRALLDRIASWTVRFTPDGEEVAFRDHVASRYTVHDRGTFFAGSADPAALAEAEYAALGLDAGQAAALRFVSTREGRFDALNTYDRARVRLGFVQFAGGRGLAPLLALAKTTRPEAFGRAFAGYGIDVEFEVVAGAIASAELVLLDPAGGPTRRGPDAERAIRDSPRLSAVLIRSGRDPELQQAQVHAAGRDYLLPALDASVQIAPTLVEVLDDLGATVSEVRAGAPARAYAATQEYRDLDAAGRIVARTAATRARLSELLTSEQGVAVLLDRAIQEGAGGGVGRIAGAARFVADARGAVDALDVAALEAGVLAQVVADFDADIEIAAQLDAAAGELQAVVAAAGPSGATVAELVALEQLPRARAALGRAVALVARKSLTTVADDELWRIRAVLERDLPPLRARLALEPEPATATALGIEVAAIRAELEALRPPAADALVMRGRVQDILGSALAAPPPEAG